MQQYIGTRYLSDVRPRQPHDSVRLLGPGLLTTEGAQHRKQRKMLTSVFSIAYLRGITSVFYETTHKVGDQLFAVKP